MKVNVRVSMSKDLRQGVLITGRSGAGKSKLQEMLAYQIQHKTSGGKAAMLVVDPHGDFAKAALGFAHNRDRERLIYISSTINRETGLDNRSYRISLNPFENDRKPETIFLLTEVLTDTLTELLSDAALSVQMYSILRPSIATVLRSKSPSLSELNRMFLESGNEDLVELGLRSDNPIHRQFFEKDFNASEYSLTKRSIRSRLNYLLSNDVVAGFLENRSTFSLEKALDDGKIIICNFSKSASSFSSQVMAKFFVAMVQACMFKRDAQDPKYRKPCYMFIDEVQSVITPAIASVISENRKYGMSMILGTQSVKAIENATVRKQIMVNTYMKCVGMTDYEDRTLFAKELSIDVKDIEKLEPLMFYLKRMNGKHTAFKFKVPILPKAMFLSLREKKELLQWIVTESGYYVPIIPPPPISKTEYQPDLSGSTKKQTPPRDGLKPAF